MTTQTKEIQSQMTADKAISILKEGNERFVNASMTNRDLLEQVKTTSTGQFPLAAILSCIDSRVPAELIFDQGIGDIFSIRIAGNVLNDDIIGSMEFACSMAGSKVIVVLGHTSCGAVKGAVAGVEAGSLTGLLEKIHPVIDKVKENTGKSASDPDFADEVVHLNAEEVAKEITERSEILAEMVQNNEIKIIYAIYSVESGQVIFK
ncbi:MAG: carbonic anhydrase family protein [Bacteroidota bacterium]